MKKFINKFYLIITLLLFLLYNIILTDLTITGLLYQIIMIGLIALNTEIILNNEDIKYKEITIILYSLTWLYSKNIYQCLFALTTILLLIIKRFKKSLLIKILTIILFTITGLLFLPLFFIILLLFGTKERQDIYESTHYYCKNNYEAYAYSAGAMDSFHYSIGKYYEIINIDGIITICYSKRNETTFEEYEEFINNNDCELVGEKNESK